MSERTEALRAQMTPHEKAMFVAGVDMWHNPSIDRLGIPALKVTDGPNGARGDGLMGTGTPTACIPSGAALGATWDPELVEALGVLLGEEACAKGSHVLLAPTINLHRSPKGGRNFECYSEDPLLTGTIAAAFVRGVQSQQVAVTAKHFVGNDSEFERNTIDSRIDERTLREVALLPFELAVKEGGAWGLMTAYNRLNGTYCSEHEWLLKTVLRDEWGFDGFVVTDWFANGSTEGSVAAQMTLEMPGPGRFYGDALADAMENGAVDEADVDVLVGHLLTLLERTGALDGRGNEPEKPLDRPEDRVLNRRAAAAGSVLLRNDGLLPLDPASVGSIAVIGPNARNAKVMGGGSATVRAYHDTSPLDALEARFPDLDVRFSLGADIDRTVPPIARPLLDGTATVEYRNGWGFDGAPDAVGHEGRTSLLAFGSPVDGIDAERWSARITATIVPEVDGPHVFTLTESGRATLRVDGAVVIDATAADIERGDAFFGFGSVEMSSEVDLRAGVPSTVEIEFHNEGAVLLAGVIVGARPLVERDLVGDAARLAAECDVALVVVGTNDDWETEGRDRDLWELPGGQPELIRAVAAANPRTVVVLNVGSPHAVDWLDDPAAVLSVGFAGQELGEAVVDMLVGDLEPSGRAPTTIGAHYEHFAAYPNYPGENSVVRYGEGVFCGHRWHDSLGIEPAVAFGSGLGYTTFEIADVPTAAAFAGGVSIDVTVTNTGGRRGSEVVQAYVEPPAGPVPRPVRELKAFEKVTLDPGESTTVSLRLDPRAFASFDPGDPVYADLAANSLVPAGGGGRHRDRPGWYVDPGDYRVHVGRSSREFAGVCSVTVAEELRIDV
ncbi:MAG: glycoside hydrolase family 3 C-terminal domain-containing protein [Actinomycetota bacterium]